MSISITNIQVNNVEYTSALSEVRLSPVTINWSFSTPNPAVLQNSVEIRLGTHKINWGTDSYSSDVYRQPFIQTKGTSWRIRSKYLSRGTSYYGQVRVKDSLREVSSWAKFAFRVNAIPFVSQVTLSPTSPSVNDDLVLSMTIPEQGLTVSIRWFKNGVIQSQFNDYTSISKQYLTYKDVWLAEITPKDALEEGRTVNSDSVTIQRPAPIAQNLFILPERPTEQDILEASYNLVYPSSSDPVVLDQSSFRWFVNGFEVVESRGAKKVRLKLVPGDLVNFQVQPSDGIFANSFVSSPDIVIASSGFRITNLKIDGLEENISVKSVNPTIEWDVISPQDRHSRYAQIQIGTSPGANNIYSAIVQTFEEKIVIPNNIVERGLDYYVTVASSDTVDSFENQATAHFRTAGSLWETKVSNSIGWTIESAVMFESGTSVDGFQRISIGDGTAFAEIRFYANRIDLLIGQGARLTYSIDMTLMRTVIVIGQNNNIKIFVSNDLIIDGTGKFSEPNSDRFIEIGSDASSDAIGHFKRLTYTITGAYDPILNAQLFSNIVSQQFIDFVEGEISDIVEFNGDVLVAVNPKNSTESGKIYKIVETEQPVLAATENIDQFNVKINSIIGSPDNKFTFISHSKGVSYFEEFFLASFDSEAVFESGVDPAFFGYELTQTTPFPAASFTRDGLVIDTTFSNTARIDSQILFVVNNVQVIRFENRYSFLWFDFQLEITASDFNLYIGATLIFTTPLVGKTVQQLIDMLEALDDSVHSYFGILIKITILNDVGHQQSSNLDSLTKQSFTEITEGHWEPIFARGNYDVLDPYNPDPYSKTSGGHWFYSHRRPGTAWFDRVDNSVGWSIDWDGTVESIEDNDRPADVAMPDGAGLYINDGKFYENIQFRTQEIILGSSGRSFLIDNTKFNKYRITGKDEDLHIFVKRPENLGYDLLGESKMSLSGTRQSNGGRPAIAEDDSGNIYVVWHDDGNNGRRQLYFKWFETGRGWNEEELIVSDIFGASNPDISIDNLGNIYVVFETQQADLTDIGIIHRINGVWSEPYLIATGLGESLNPKVAIDRRNGVHVCWEDYREVNPEIYYCFRDPANGQWQSSAFGREDIRVTNSPYGAVRPCITCQGLAIAIAWTTLSINGNSSIYMAQSPGIGVSLPSISLIGTNKVAWNSSGQRGSDFLVSSFDSNGADFSDIAFNDKGMFFVTWHEVEGKTFQIKARMVGPLFRYARPIVTLTNSDIDCRFPKIGLHRATQNVYIVYEKGEYGVVDPYDPYGSFDERNVSILEPSIRISRYNNGTQTWDTAIEISTLVEPPNILDILSILGPSGFSTGSSGFSVQIYTGDQRVCRRPIISTIISNANMNIMYESQMVVNVGENLLSQQIFTTIRDAVFNFTWEPVYDLTQISDPYLEYDVEVSGEHLRKEIRFGDFSDTVGVRYVIQKIRYYLNGSYDPFNIRFISPATTNMPSVNVLQCVSNNRGDAWLATDNGLLFFNNRTNKVFLFDDDKFGISGKKIKTIAFDRNSNMYLGADDGVYVSIDHEYFWKMTGNLPTSVSSLDVDSRNRLHIGSSLGLYIIEVSDIVSQIKTTKDTAIGSKTIAVTNIIKIDDSNGLPDNNVAIVRIDANDVAWIGTGKGLARYGKGQISSFTMLHGLSSSKITDIAIKNTAVRFLATTAGVDVMTGVTIEKLDFGTLESPVIGIVEKSPDVEIPTFNHIRSLHWRKPNVLFIATTHSIYQIEFKDDAFQAEKTKITKFESRDFTLTNVVPFRNDDLQTFRIVGIEDRQIPKTVLYEVLINGKKITRGYKFSADKQLIRFDYPLRENDVIKINVRFDVEIVNDFTQNEAQRLALGNQSTRIEKLLSYAGNIYVQTGGDINNIQINDEYTDLPFDRITLDTHPPRGKLEIGGQIDSTVFRVFVRKLFENNEYVAYDETSGIDKMIVSNFTNFTTDGSEAQSTVPFSPSSNHDIGIIFDSITREFTFPSGKGRRIMRWIRTDGSMRMLAGTANPANIYMFDPITALWSLKATLDDHNEDSSIEFITQYQNRLIVGTGNPNGIGKIWSSIDGQTFSLLRTLPVKFAYCSEIFAGVLYVGAGENIGQLYAYDGTNFQLVFDQISGAIFDIVQAEGDLYAVTGHEGRTYRLDPVNKTQQILDTNYDQDVISVGFAEINKKKIIFTGTGSTGQIRRSTLPDSPFVHSFKTVPSPVYSMARIGGNLWATIGNIVFLLDNVWNAKYTHSEDIHDISVGLSDVPWFISDGYIYKIGNTSEIKNVYLKLIDRAGNETKLFTDELQTQLDSNLYDSITLQQLIEFTNQNRILEVDEFGNTVFVYTDDSSFYSADKIDEEVGVYYSEIFNGTNDLVSWDRISWETTIPSNTSITVQVRVGISRDDLLDAKFNISIDGTKGNGDISFLTGHYLQFKIIMKSRIRGLSPSLRNVVVRSVASQASHFFTTNFVLPSRIKSAILTSTKLIPVSADIIFGFTGNNSIDFADYQIIDENRVFTTDNKQVGSNIRVGIKLLTPAKGEVISESFGEYGPYNSLLFFNAVDWKFKNTSGNTDTFQFRVKFYEDFALRNPIYVAYSGDNSAGFSEDGDAFQNTGAVLENGENSSFSFVPVGETPLLCNTYYFVIVEASNGNNEWSTILEDYSFIEACGTTFVDTIDFEFTNAKVTQPYNFRIRFYSNPERTNLFVTTYSGNDSRGWTYDGGNAFPPGGLTILGGSTVAMSYVPDAVKFETAVTYYLAIDAFDGSKFINNSNSFTFRTRGPISNVYCSPYSDVPIVRNFAVMFELDGDQFVTLKVE